MRACIMDLPTQAPIFMPDASICTTVLRRFGANDAEVDELLAYNTNHFTQPDVPAPVPMPDEPFVEAWRQYQAEAETYGVFEALRRRLVQLRLPIEAGISETDAYRGVTRRGTPVPLDQVGVTLVNPEALTLTLHATPAGHVPVMTTPERADFVALVQALVCRNEPRALPASMGACMVTGYNNWDRVATLRTTWEAENPGAAPWQWQQAWRRFMKQKPLFQDRFMILSNGPYSAVPADALGLDEATWKAHSLTIRREHECAHYFTKRVLGSMKNALLDELVADYMGIRAALGHYRADWFLRFMGLEDYPAYREGGRLQNYRGKPALSDGAFRVLQQLVVTAAGHLEAFDATLTLDAADLHDQAVLLQTVTAFPLEVLADDTAVAALHQRLDAVLQQVAHPM